MPAFDEYEPGLFVYYKGALRILRSKFPSRLPRVEVTDEGGGRYLVRMSFDEDETKEG